MKRVVISLFCLFVLFSNSVMAYEKEINAMSASMSEKISESGKKTIAVVDFTDLQGNVTELGRFLAEEFSVSLADAGKGFEVVDRTHLKSIIKEHKLSSTGLIDSSTARQLGKIAGVESLITGTITPFGDTIRIAVKILDTETAKIIGASRTNLAKTGALVDLISKGIASASAGGAPKTSTTAASTSSEPAAVKMFAEAKEKAKSGTIQTVTKNEITFDLKSCRRNGKTITFDLVVTKNDKDANFEIVRHWSQYRTKMFDNMSNEYTATVVKLANKRTERSSAEHLMLKGLPAKSQLIFDGVSDEAQFIAMLHVACELNNNKDIFHIQFRNIPITQ